MGVNPMEGQLFSYTFTLPANPRKHVNRLKKGKEPRKAPKTTSKDTQPSGIKDKKKQTVPTVNPKNAATPKQPRPKKTPEDRRVYEQDRSETPERKEYKRKRQRRADQIAKETGKCKRCSSPAIPGQTRCETCAEKHRIERRTSDSKKRSEKKAEQKLMNQG